MMDCLISQKLHQFTLMVEKFFKALLLQVYPLVWDWRKGEGDCLVLSSYREGRVETYQIDLQEMYSCWSA